MFVVMSLVLCCVLYLDLGHIPENIKECQNLQVLNFGSNPLQQ